MELSTYFKSIVDLDEQAIVICNTEHTVIYMNPAAQKRYEKRGNLVGKSLLDCHNERSRMIVNSNLERMKSDVTVNKIFEVHSEKNGANNDVFFVAIRDENGTLIGYYEKFEDRNLYTENTTQH
jgi:DUF438 domain-containing protein